MISQRNHTGFTLIELVVVIIVLGILAVVAAPKFINLKSDAVKANMEALEGALRSANSLVYSKAVIKNQHQLNNGSIISNDTTINTTMGYVSAESSNLANALDMSLESISAVTDPFTADWGVIDFFGFITLIIPKDRPFSGNCLLLYAVLPNTTDGPFYLPLTDDC
ncbi:pilus assembly FimT family protein [Shewanella waksmanii]|uniref:pilus assembly FimT family protein n=1 Tax=Shewanella waksmanii TaxID=213783 RepID=UPI0004BC3612|nr:prepilin-type N-terminal cleavage/methylation domain-containing protein [Shewanella waksmanii]